MRALPTVGQIMTLVRQESASVQTKQASAPEPVYSSDVAKGLHEIAEIVKSAAAAPSVTYEDVMSFGRQLLHGGQR